MKKISQFDLSDEIRSYFGIDNVMIVMSRLVSERGVLVSRNKRPGQQLFNGVVSFGKSSWGPGWDLKKANGDVLYMESGKKSKYLLRNHANAQQATEAYVLASGAADEMYSFLPELNIDLSADRLTAKVYNDCKINQTPWNQVPPSSNRDIDQYGCMWTVDKVSDGDNGGPSRYISNGNVVNANTGSGRLEYVVISKQPGEGVDYVWNPNDAEATLSLAMAVGVKDFQEPVIVSLKTIFEP
jgi:hypothetical protein